MSMSKCCGVFLNILYLWVCDDNHRKNIITIKEGKWKKFTSNIGKKWNSHICFSPWIW